MKKMIMKIKKLNVFKLFTSVLTFGILICLLAANSNVKASSYIYDYWKNVIPSSEGITYKETYYNTNITSISDVNQNITRFNYLVDMEVYDSTIYLLDQNKTGTTEVPLATSTINSSTNSYPTYAGVSYIVVINQNFQYETIIDEFLLTDYAKNKLDEYYHFTTPLDKITAAQYTSTEFVDIYDVETKTAVVDASNLTDGKTIILASSLTTSLKDEEKSNFILKVNGEIIDETTYEVEVSDGTATITLDSAYAEGTEFSIIHKYVSTLGRAPYLPYSKDFTQAAVRLNNAQGITVTKDGIYVADTENSRILKLNFNFVVEDVYFTPDDTTFYQMYDTAYETEYGTAYETVRTTNSYYKTATSDSVFQPTKVAVNKSGTLYCIASDIYEGLIEYNAETKFNRFLGKNEVTANAIKQMWSNFLSETQLGSFALDLPPMFSNITVSPSNFLYATSMPDSDATTVSKLVKVVNNKGNDIMKRTGYVTPDGDAVYLSTSTESNVVTGPSVITAVAVSETGNFTIVDQTRGRLFTYDAEGNLLYITGDQPGGTSSQGTGNGLSSSIIKPVAVDYLYRTNENGEQEEIVIVLDQYSSSIILFETTEFGEAVNQATYLYQNGVISDTYAVDAEGNYLYDEDGEIVVAQAGAETYWRKVIKMNTNYELAYLGIGKALNLRGEYKEAMKYFKLAHNATYYSKAYSNYRDGILNENFNLIMTCVVVIIGAYVLKKICNAINRKNEKYKLKGDK